MEAMKQKMKTLTAAKQKIKSKVVKIVTNFEKDRRKEILVGMEKRT